MCDWMCACVHVIICSAEHAGNIMLDGGSACLFSAMFTSTCCSQWVNTSLMCLPNHYRNILRYVLSTVYHSCSAGLDPVTGGGGEVGFATTGQKSQSNMRGQPSVAHVRTETIIMFLKCCDIMSDQMHAWTDIGQDKSDMKTFCSLCSQSFQFFSIIEHHSCITSY